MLSVERLCAGYGGSSVLRDVDLQVNRGAAALIIGPNGAGKSTLLRTLSGLVRERSGRVLLEGRDIAACSADSIARAGLIHVPEGRRVFVGLTVLENLRAGALAAQRRQKRSHESRLVEVLDLFPPLKDRLGNQAQTLSGGEQQMLAIGRALMGHPSALLIDEPAMGLAPVIVERLIEHLCELRERWSVALVIAEQSTAQLGEIADRTYVLRSGHLEEIAGSADGADDLLSAYQARNSGNPE